ncbi:ABC transporter substrate-binding protein [bacterium]|nr:ABC transporter substrate-binding protein [bacterium]
MGRLPACLCLLLAAAIASPIAAAASDDPSGVEDAPARIVSLAPSITELIFALNVGDRVVGVTDWCRHPAAVTELPSIGGHVDPNLEAVVALRPDLAVVEAANTEAAERLTRLGVEVCVVEHRHVEGILASVLQVGEACGVVARAELLHADLQRRLAAVAGRPASDPRPRTMIVVGREVSSGRLSDLYVAGAGTFLGDLLALAGGDNVMPESAVSYPMISAEGLLRLAPEVVIDLAPECADDPQKLAELERAWRQHTDVPAVRAGRVHVVTDDALLIPGPRFVETLELLASILDAE